MLTVLDNEIHVAYISGGDIFHVSVIGPTHLSPSVNRHSY